MLALHEIMNDVFFFSPSDQLRLLCMFALSVKYAGVDVSLAVSSGLLSVLWSLCGQSAAALCQASHVLVYSSHSSVEESSSSVGYGVGNKDTLLQVASHTLMHILAVTVGSVNNGHDVYLHGLISFTVFHFFFLFDT